MNPSPLCSEDLERLTKALYLFVADAGAGEREHGFVDVGATGMSSGEVAVGMQPGDRALYDPALFSEAGSVAGLLSGDPGCDAAVAEFFAVAFGVICPVGVQPRGCGTCRGGPVGGARSTSSVSCVTSWRCPPVRATASGVPLPSTIRWCLLPRRRRSTGEGPVCSPPFWPAHASCPRRLADGLSTWPVSWSSSNNTW